MTAFWCEHAVLPGGVKRSVRLLTELGRIVDVRPEKVAEPDDVVLRGVVLPGLANAHSHAFHRALRGRTHDDGGNFWTWRDAMYRAALTLSPEDVYAVSRFCFIEMLRAGITTVGEFHYLQNDPSGYPYANRNELAEQVIAAAVDVGLRICLLNTCYATGGIAQPLLPEQRRFATTDIDVYLDATESLADAHVGDALVTVGVAPHSLRAVPREWVRMLHAWAGTHDAGGVGALTVRRHRAGHRRGGFGKRAARGLGTGAGGGELVRGDRGC